MSGSGAGRDVPTLPKGIAVSRDPAALRGFATDNSGRAGVAPSAVTMPKNEKDVRALVSWARANGIPLVPVSSRGGPRRRGDTVPTARSIVVDMSDMKRIIHVDAKDALAIIEPGVTFGELDEALRPHGLRSFRPLVARPSKSVIAAFLEREPSTVPGRSWDSADPLAAMQIVFGDGQLFHTGGAALPGSLERNLELGNRPLLSVGPVHTDFGRVLQGAQGALGIVTWASIYCQRVPAMERPVFLSSDDPAKLITVAYALLRRRPEGQLFLLNARQLAMMAAGNVADLDRVTASLPAWVLYFEVSAPDYFAQEAMDFQMADIERDAKLAGVTLSEKLADFPAQQLRQRQVSGDLLPHEGVAEIRREVICLSQLDALPQILGHLSDEMLAQAAIHVQPAVHGVSAQIALTFLADAAGEVRCNQTARSAAERLADAGAFFSRPYHPWADLAFASDPAILGQLSRVKSFFDPDSVLQPGAQSLGGLL